MSALPKSAFRMTVEDFFTWDAGDGARYELVDGEPSAMAPASNVHGLLQNELGRLIGNHLRRTGSGCDVLANPGVIPRLLSAHNVRVPDLAVTCSGVAPGRSTLSDPVLVVEVLSPSNQAKTWANVWAYASIPSVREIVVLHSERIAADVLRRGPDGAWPDRLDPATDDLVLDSIAFRVGLAELYERTGLSG